MISSFTTVPATVTAFGCLSLACELKHRRMELCTDKWSSAGACEPVSLLVEHLQRVRRGTCELKVKCCLHTNACDRTADIETAVNDHKSIKTPQAVSHFYGR